MSNNTVVAINDWGVRWCGGSKSDGPEQTAIDERFQDHECSVLSNAELLSWV